MASFLKVLFHNLLDGPSTDPFPLGETFTPDRVRGRCVIDPELCVGCGICKNVCAAGAIDISEKADKSGYTITVWRDSCCLCASCRHYCPTGAMSLNNDWHNVHLESEKFDCIEQHTINYEPCTHCGTLFRPLPLKIAQKLYAKDPNLDPDRIRRLCPKCRQLEDAKRNENITSQTLGQKTLVEGEKGEAIEIISSEKAMEKTPGFSPEASIQQEQNAK